MTLFGDADAQHVKPDPRVRRTQLALQNALVELTVRHGFAAVTVRGITELAGVNRVTFYRHYEDKFDMLDRFTQEIYQLLDMPDELVVSEEQIPREVGVQKVPAGMVKMLEHVRDHAPFYRAMLGKKGDPGFGNKIQRYVRERLTRSLSPELRAHPHTELYLSYVASGSIGVILWWLDHGAAYSPEDVAAIAIRLSVADLHAVLGGTA